MTKTEQEKIAKKLFTVSVETKKLSPEDIRKIVKALKDLYGHSSIGIIKHYLKLLESHQRNSQVVIESAYEINKKTANKIRRHFEKKKGRDLGAVFEKNKALLGGLRVTVGDDQWDLSLKGRIDMLKESIGG